MPSGDAFEVQSAMKTIEIDWVEEWLADQERRASAPRRAVVPHTPGDAAKVEEMFDMLDPVKKPTVVKAGPVAASDPALSFEDVLDEPPVSAAVEDVVERPIVDRTMDDTFDEPMDDAEGGSADRALSSVEDLYEAFKRLEQQLDTISDSLQTYSQHP